MMTDNIHNLLQTILTTFDNNLRQSLEQQLSSFFSTPGFGESLVKVASVTQLDPSLRQFSLIVLKNYVKTQWEKPECLESDKNIIKQMILPLLADPNSKIRSAISLVIANICHFDFPDNWNGLLEFLLDVVSSYQNLPLLQGALRTLTFISEDLSNVQLPNVISVIFPSFINILSSPNYDWWIKGHCVTIFRQLSSSLDSFKDSHIKKILKPTFQIWLDLFIQILKEPIVNISNIIIFSLKIEVVSTLIALTSMFEILMIKPLRNLLPVLWDCLTNTIPIYLNEVVYNEHYDPSNNFYDEDGLEISIDVFLDQALSFFMVIARSTSKKIMRNLDDDNIMTILIYVIINLMQITPDILKLWNENPNEYLSFEEDESNIDTIRSQCKSLILLFSEVYGERLQRAVIVNVQRILNEQPNNIQLRESCSLAISLISDDIVELNNINVPNNSTSIVHQVHSFLQNVCMIDLKHNDNAWLKGRALHYLCSYVSLLTLEEFNLVLQYLIEYLKENHPLPLRLESTTGLGKLCLIEKVSADFLHPFLLQTIPSLCQIITLTNEETLHLVLDTLSVILKFFNADSLLSVLHYFIPVLLKTWSQHADDRLVTECVLDIIEIIASQPQCHQSLMEYALPTLLNILNNPYNNIPGIVEACIDILIQIINYSNNTDISSFFLVQILPIISQIILQTEDHDIIDTGAKFLTSLIRKAYLQIPSISFNNNLNGLTLYSQIIYHLLSSSNINDSAAINVGPLISHYIIRFGSQLPLKDIVDLIQLVIYRLQRSELPLMQQSLILVFARLILNNCGQFLDVLSSLPPLQININGIQSATSCIEYVLTCWVENQLDFPGSYQNKIAYSSLATLLSIHDPRLMAFQVNGYPLIHQNMAKVTRSISNWNKSHDIQYSQIPFYSKVLSLLLQQWQDEYEDKKLDDEEEFLDDTDEDNDYDNDDGEDFEQDDQYHHPNPFVHIDGEFKYLKNLIDNVNDIDDDDMDAKEDPINQINLETSIVQYIQNLNSNDHQFLEMIGQHLNDVDKLLLNKVINVTQIST